MSKKEQSDNRISNEIKPLANTPKAISKDFKHYLTYHLGRTEGCDPFYLYEALSYSLRDRVVVN